MNCKRTMFFLKIIMCHFYRLDMYQFLYLFILHIACFNNFVSLIEEGKKRVDNAMRNDSLAKLFGLFHSLLVFEKYKANKEIFCMKPIQRYYGIRKFFDSFTKISSPFHVLLSKIFHLWPIILHEGVKEGSRCSKFKSELFCILDISWSKKKKT